MWVSVFGCVHVSAGALRGQTRLSLELESPAVVSCPLWEPGATQVACKNATCSNH